MIRPWQPAFPQAMQRHGGQTRPAVPPVAKAATEAAKPPRETTDDDDRGGANRGTAADKSSESKD